MLRQQITLIFTCFKQISKVISDNAKDVRNFNETEFRVTLANWRGEKNMKRVLIYFPRLVSEHLTSKIAFKVNSAASEMDEKSSVFRLRRGIESSDRV